MKACANCRAVHADDYGGMCTDCGAPMGAGGGQNVNWHLAEMQTAAARSRDDEHGLASMRSGARPIDARLVEDAKRYLIPIPGEE